MDPGAVGSKDGSEADSHSPKRILVSCSPLPQAATTPRPTEDPRIADLTARLEGAQRELADLTAQLQATQRDLVSAQQDIEQAQTVIAQIRCCGTFLMWRNLLTLRPKEVLIGAVPDTFTLRVRFTATAPVRARIMTIDEYVDLRSGRPISVLTYDATTSLDVLFHEVEGCASYVFVLDASETAVVIPDIRIIRAPADGATGACR